MTDISNNSSKQGMFKDRRWLPSIILFGLLFLNATLLFLPGGAPTQGMRVFFWQRYNGYLFQLQCLILLVVPIVAMSESIFLFWKERTSRQIVSLIAGVFLFFLCVFINYTSLFIARYASLIGTVSFNGNIYHLVRYDKYDDPSEYYLGKCDQSGYWCVFHAIYEFFEFDPGSPQIVVSGDASSILVKMGNDTVYMYDGQKGECTDDLTVGWCVESPP